ncbi:MAG: DUF2845 domain-containing protein [Methylococcaceae bacterium]
MFIPEHAIALRCGNKLVNIGDHIPTVISLCGAPEYTETREIHLPDYCYDNRRYNNNSPYYYKQHNSPRFFSNQAICQYQVLDIWIYNFGPRKFMRELIFYKGIVKEINALEYGY